MFEFRFIKKTQNIRVYYISQTTSLFVIIQRVTLLFGVRPLTDTAIGLCILHFSIKRNKIDNNFSPSSRGLNNM